MARTFSLLALAALGVALVASRKVAVAQQAPGKIRVSFTMYDAFDYWDIARQGAKKAAKELNVEVDFPELSTWSSEEQDQIIRDLGAKHINGLVLPPINPLYQRSPLKPTTNELLLLAQDPTTNQYNRVCYLSADNRAAGRQAGAELKRVLPHGGYVVVFVDLASRSVATERIQGLKTALQGSKINILEVRPDFGDPVGAEINVANALTDYPMLSACVGIRNYNGQAILQALRKAKKTGKIKIVSFDEQDDVLTGIARGEVSAAIVEQPFEIGYTSIATLTKCLRGNHGGVPEVQQILVPPRTIRRDNVGAYKRQLRQWQAAS